MSGQELAEFDYADEPMAGGGMREYDARPIPRISIQCFCETPELAEALQVAAEDRRLTKAHVSIHMGGISAAVSHYQESPTPNLIVVESRLPRNQALGELDRLAGLATLAPRLSLLDTPTT